MCAAFHANTGFLGLPFTAALLGTDALPEAITYDQLVSTPWLLVVAFSIGAAHAPDAREQSAACARSSPATPRCSRWSRACWRPTRSRRTGPWTPPTSWSSRWRRSASSRSACTRRRSGGDGIRFPPPLSAPVVAASRVKLTVPVAVVAGCAALIHDVPDAFLVQAAMPTGLNAPAAGRRLQPRPRDHRGRDRVHDRSR